jgi:hypothetical protein
MYAGNVLEDFAAAAPAPEILVDRALDRAPAVR